MKIRTFLCFLLAVTLSQSWAASIPIHIHLEDPTSSADVDIPEGADEALRIKRSGSGSPDFFGYIKRGITGKISQIAQASAGASAHFSRGSSGGGGGYHYPAPGDTPLSYGTKSFDFWTLKKSIVNTLIQAVKAINGGIIAFKGQLIKGGGAIISAKGRLISMKGEAIASVGRHIIQNSKLSPSPYHSSKPEPEYIVPSAGPTSIAHPSPSYGPPPSEYGPPSSPSAPSASAPTAGFPEHPPSTYGAPTAPAYGPPIGPSGSAAPSQAYLPQKVAGPYEGAQAGIIILKKIPKHVPPTASLAALPLQDERNKVVKPSVDVTKTQLFSPESPKETPPFKHLPPPSPPSAPYIDAPSKHPFFESAVKPVPPPEVIYASPIDAPPSSGGSAPSGHSAPVGPVLPTLSPPGYVDESLLSHNSPDIQQPSFDINKPLSHYKEVKDFPNIWNQHNNVYLSKIPAPFQINSFGGNSFNNHGLGPHNSLPGPLKIDFRGAVDVPPFTNVGHSGTDFSSNLQYKNGFLEHKGVIPPYDVVKSVSYELPAHKRQ